MGLKNEEARARRRQKQKELLSCVSIKSEEEIRRSYRPELSLENNFGWQVVEKTQVGDGSFPHLTGFYEKPDLSGKEFQKVTYVLYMDKGSVVKKDCIVEEAEPLSRVESVRAQPSSVRVVDEPSEIIQPPVKEVPRREPKPPTRQKKLIRDFYYRDLRSRSPSKSRSQSPESIASQKKRGRDKSNRRLMDTLARGKSDGGDSDDEPNRKKSSRRLMDKLSRGKSDVGDSDDPKRKKSSRRLMDRLARSKSDGGDSDEPKRKKSSRRLMDKLSRGKSDVGDSDDPKYDEYGRRKSHKKKSKMISGFQKRNEVTKSMESVNSQPSQLQRVVSFERGIEQKKEKARKDMELRKEGAAKEGKDKKQNAIDKAKERMERRNKKFENWGLRAGASSENVENDDKLEKRTCSLGRRHDKSIMSLRSNQSGLIESVRALPDKFRKPSESLMETPSGSNKYLYIPVGKRNRSLSKREIK